MELTYDSQHVITPSKVSSAQPHSWQQGRVGVTRCPRPCNWLVEQRSDGAGYAAWSAGARALRHRGT